jgi:putative tricarboxylic transport membrane protein
MEESRFSLGEVVSGAVLAVLGLFIIFQASGWNYMSSDGPGPGFFPMWYGIAMVVLALLLVVTNLVKRRASDGRPRFDRAGVTRAVVAWAAFGVCAALLGMLGFVLGFGLLTLFVVMALYRKPLKVALPVAIATALGFYLVFPLALDVSLPVGIWGF